MKKSETVEMRRLKAVQLLLKRHQSVYDGFPGLERASLKLNSLLEEMDAVLELQRRGSVPVTLEKHQHRTALEKLMLTACSHLMQVAEELDLDGLRDLALMYPYILSRLRAEDLAAEASVLLNELLTYEVSLEETGYTLDDRGALSDALDTFKAWMDSPREAIDIRKVGTKSIPELIKAGRRLIRRQLVGFMERYALSNPEFYLEFQEARRLKRVAVHHESEDGGTAAAA